MTDSEKFFAECEADWPEGVYPTLDDYTRAMAIVDAQKSSDYFAQFPPATVQSTGSNTFTAPTFVTTEVAGNLTTEPWYSDSNPQQHMVGSTVHVRKEPRFVAPQRWDGTTASTTPNEPVTMRVVSDYNVATDQLTARIDGPSGSFGVQLTGSTLKRLKVKG